MATTYRDATEAAAIAEMFIAEHHTHLKQARIIWLATTSGQSRARVCNALLQHAFGKDASGVFPAFCVVVTDTDWAAHRKTRGALIDTLLCSMDRQSNADTGKDRWALRKPDVSLYLAVVKRHGLNTTEEQQVGRLIKDLPVQLALAMGSDDEDDNEDITAGLDYPQDARSADSDAVSDEDDWEDAPRPDVSPEALSRIRGSVEAVVQ